MRNKYFISLLLTLTFFISNEVSASVFSKADALSFAQSWITKKSNNEEVNYTVNQKCLQEITENKNVITYIFSVSPQGYVVVTSNNNTSTVLAYSLDNNFIDASSNEGIIATNLISQLGHNYLLESDESTNIISKVSTTDFEIGPFVQSLWGQVNCYNNNNSLVNVSNYYTPSNYAPGCVAVSMATLMHHYTWPIVGIGSHTDIDSYGNSRGNYTAEFENTQYDWGNILTRYKNKPSTDIQREAEGLLLYQTAIALNMDFENNGSTSNVNRIPDAGNDFFRYSSMFRSESSSVFWQLLDTSMFNEIPVVFSVSGNGYGHSVVCDGIRIESNNDYYYHLNMGWWGTSNGWYRIRDSFNAGGYSVINGGVFNFLPIPVLETPIVSATADLIQLNWQYAPNCIADAYEVEQKINNGNWESISNDIHDTALSISVDPSSIYAFRVKAKYKNSWSFSSWSNEEQVRYLGVNDNVSLDDISCGPNPVNDRLNIYFPTGNKTIDLSVYNSIGNTILNLNKTNLTNIVTISTVNWSSGLYFVRLTDGTNSKVINVIKK